MAQTLFVPSRSGTDAKRDNSNYVMLPIFLRKTDSANPLCDESLCDCLRTYVSKSNCFSLARESVNASEEIVVALTKVERTNYIDMNVVENVEADSLPHYFGFLTL